MEENSQSKARTDSHSLHGLLGVLRKELRTEAQERWLLSSDTGSKEQMVASLVLNGMANALERTLRSTPNAKVADPKDSAH